MSSVTLIHNFYAMLSNDVMDTIEEIRRKRLLLLLNEYGSNVALANVTNKSDAQISQWINKSPDSKTGRPRAINSDSAREIELATGKPIGWMDQVIGNFSEFDPEMQEMLKMLSKISKEERKFFKRSLGMDIDIPKIANGNGNGNGNGK